MTSPRVRSADRRADRAQVVCYFEVTSPSGAKSGTHQADPLGVVRFRPALSVCRTMMSMIESSICGGRMSDRQSMGGKHGRRDFLKASGAVTAAFLAPSALVAEATKTMPGLPVNPLTPSSMPTRNLGKTGYKVGIFSLGGQAALEHANNFDAAVPIIERALDLGVNYIDTSSIYGGPERWSEQYVGRVMAHRRNEAFLATKTKERTRDDSMRMIEKSLQLLQTDHVDLWQLHDIGTMTDVNAVFAKGGAMEALIEMQQQKVVRYLGLTGHYRPESLMEGIRRYPFDALLMAMNAADPHHYSFNEGLLPLAVERQMGIIG